MAADHRSAHPNLPGVPWWAAILIAVTFTTIGFAFDAGSGGKELGGVFAVLYVLGCVVAVLAVRHSGIFTAVIQPPLLLFVAVPGAYFLFNGAKFTGLKDTLINCGYPLIERFPLMLFTSAAVLLIGMARWYYAMWSSVRTPEPAADPAGGTAVAAPQRFGGLTAKVSSFFGAGSGIDNGRADEATPETAAGRPRRKHGIDRPATTERRARSERSAQRPAPTRSRHARPPLDDFDEPPRERARRQPTARQGDPARRRPRPPQEPGYRTPPPPRRQPPPDREAYRPRAPRGNRFEPYEPYEPYPPYEPPAPPRRRPPPPPRPDDLNGDSGTHHPVSRVRYRDAGYDR